MKKMRSIFFPFLIVSITLSLVTGYGFIKRGNTASAASKKITVKDFTLTLPKNWSSHYVMKKSKKIKQGSFVAFYAKKCYNETKEGWLFSIMRYKDDSYLDMPSYELVGKWNGYHYVAIFPTDVQTEGATETARKEYAKLNTGSRKAAMSIRPVKKVRKGKGVYRVSDFSLLLPANWKNNYIVKNKGKKKKDSYVFFCAKKCYEQTGEGTLFSIARYADESYQELPSYELVGMWNGIYYVAVFPTDVQFVGATKAAVKQYTKCNQSVKKVVKSIQP